MICINLYVLNPYPSELKYWAGLNQLPGMVDEGIANCDKHKKFTG